MLPGWCVADISCAWPYDADPRALGDAHNGEKIIMAQPSPLYSLTGSAKIEVDTRVRRKLRTVLKIRLNTNGWDETQPLKK